ncbi:MAG: T9SS type A sorting domain-containing protein [Chitinophagaceae bacterium]|nr:T9SS type A sorting domain-containing protein [Chitinophagaceae bacterium]
MKFGLLFILVIFNFAQSFSQSPYIPLDLDNTSWCIRKLFGAGPWCLYDVYSVPTSYIGFNGKVYKEVLVYNQRIDCPMYIVPYETMYIRNDIPNRKVYVGNMTSTPSEYLLYDFSLQIGDTLKTDSMLELSSPRILGSIDSILINNVWHRRYYYHDTMSPQPLEFDTLVEGIGYTFRNIFEGGNSMRSFCKDSMIIYQSDTGVYCYLPVATSNLLDPNPQLYYANGTVFMNNVFGEIEIINSMGSVVFRKNKQDAYPIDCSFLNPGIYYLRVRNLRQKATLKFIKE